VRPVEYVELPVARLRSPRLSAGAESKRSRASKGGCQEITSGYPGGAHCAPTTVAGAANRSSPDGPLAGEAAGNNDNADAGRMTDTRSPLEKQFPSAAGTDARNVKPSLTSR